MAHEGERRVGPCSPRGKSRGPIAVPPIRRAPMGLVRSMWLRQIGTSGSKFR